MTHRTVYVSVHDRLVHVLGVYGPEFLIITDDDGFVRKHVHLICTFLLVNHVVSKVRC